MRPAQRFAQLTLTESQRAAFLERVRPAIGAADYQLIEGMSYALPELLALIEQDPMTLHKLRLLLVGLKTEKTQQVCSPATPPPAAPPSAKSKTPRAAGGPRPTTTPAPAASEFPIPSCRPASVVHAVSRERCAHRSLQRSSCETRGRRPLISNTDQGSEFTSEAYIDAVESAGVEAGMDRRGRWLDNRFIERLWRSVK